MFRTKNMKKRLTHLSANVIIKLQKSCLIQKYCNEGGCFSNNQLTDYKLKAIFIILILIKGDNVK